MWIRLRGLQAEPTTPSTRPCLSGEGCAVRFAISGTQHDPLSVPKARSLLRDTRFSWLPGFLALAGPGTTGCITIAWGSLSEIRPPGPSPAPWGRLPWAGAWERVL